jgi:hypothetical protein
MDWEIIKARARFFYAWASQVLVFFQVLLYLAACVLASKPLGPKDYASFIYLIAQWAPEHSKVCSSAVADLGKR